MIDKNLENSEVRVRFAPSPTGTIHIGNLRTALFAWLYAKNQEGVFFVRVEDTDQKRLDTGATKKIFETLNWVGIDVNEGVYLDENKNISQKGDFGPYIQSERLDIYKEKIQELLKKGSAYYCFCSVRKLEQVREEQKQNGLPPMYDKKCRDLSKEEIVKKIKNGEKYVIRMKIPANEMVHFSDKVFGNISVETNSIDDQVLIKADGFPTYHFAVVVDDHLMKISHIIRGEDWIPSTPKHVLLYKFFDWKVPKFVHLPNVLGENKKKLSKRQGDISVEDFKQKGYLPEVLINFLALLGWNPKNNQEIIPLEELIKKFNISGINKAGAVFDYKKLDWMNSQYIKNLSDNELLEKCNPYIKQYFKDNQLEIAPKKIDKVIRIEKTRIKKLSDITENLDSYFKDISYDKKLLTWKGASAKETKEALEKVFSIISNSALQDIDSIQAEILAEIGDARGEHLWPLRVALSGKERSVSPFELAWILKRRETLLRINNAIEKLN